MSKCSQYPHEAIDVIPENVDDVLINIKVNALNTWKSLLAFMPQCVIH